MAKLFISYRRADSQHAVDRLYEGLRKHLKKSDIFIDVDNIPKGVDFVEHLSKQVAQCETLLVVVGPQWLTIKDEDGRRRLDDPQDFVRIEIEAALKRDIPVIPILLDNTPMPKAADLPPALQGFERRNAALLRRDAFRADLGELIEDLGLKRSGGAGRIAAAALLLAAIGAGGAAWMLDPLGWRAPTLAPDAGEEAIAATEIPPQQAAEAFADLIDPDTPGAAPDFSAIPEQIATKEPQTTETPPEDPAIRNAAIRRVQAALKRMGLYDGALDGDAGPGTRNAAAAYAEPKFLDPPDLSTAALDDITRFAERAGEDADAFEADERNAWAEVGGSGSIVLLEGFLRDYPKGVNAEKARGQIASLNAEAAAAAQRAQAAREAEAQAWALAQRTDTKAGYERYLASHASGANASTARAKLKALESPSTPGQVFRDALSGGGAGPEMVVIPSGQFVMGSPASEAGRDDDEGPVRTVRIDYKFAVGKYEVTWAEWGTCVADGACDDAGPVSKGGDEGWGRGSRPVINVDWNDAQAYVRWLSRKTGKTYRLLSEAEWEYSARAGTTTAYWWGDRASHDYANYGKDQCCSGLASGRDEWVNTAPVGRFPANAFGLYDMHGNVWEWTQDCWNGSYSGAPTNGSAWISGDCSRRVLRGGSWYLYPRLLRSASRFRSTTSVPSYVVGFRVARTL